MRVIVLLVVFSLAATAQPKPAGPVPPGITFKQLPDKVWRFDRSPSSQPAFWQQVLSLFGLRPTGTNPFNRSVALLVGVAQYATLRPQLEFVDSDLTELRNFLLTNEGFDTVFEIRNGVVQRSLIEDYMVNKFSVESNDYLQAEDRLLFYYSGHGADKQGRVGYLQFGNAVPGNFAGEGVLPLTQFREWARLNVAKHLAVILDACASGLAVAGKGDPSPEALLNALSGQGSGFLLTAGTGDQKAWQVEYSYNKGFSVFTRGLLQALKEGVPDNTGLMTINELFGRAEKFVGRFDVEQDKRMVPRIWELNRRDGEAKGTFVFLNPNARSPQVPSLYSKVLTAKPKGASEEREGQEYRSLNRAYLSVRGGRILQYTNQDRQVSFQISLSNTGLSPAEIKENSLELFVAKDEDIPLPAETFSGEVIRAGKHNLPLEVPPRADGQLQTLLCFCLGTTPRDEKIGLFARLVYDDIFGEAHSLQWGWQVDLRDAFVIDDLENVGAFTIEKVFADDVVEQVMKRALISGGTTGKY